MNTDSKYYKTLEGQASHMLKRGYVPILLLIFVALEAKGTPLCASPPYFFVRKNGSNARQPGVNR